MLKQILSRSNSPARSSTPDSQYSSDSNLPAEHDENSPLLPPNTNPPIAASTIVQIKNNDNSSPSSCSSTTALGEESVWIPLLTSGMLLNGIWATVLQSTLSAALETTLPLFVKTEFGYGSQQTGWLFTTLVIPSFIAPLVGWLNDRYLSGVTLILVGFLASTPIFVGLGFMSSQPLPTGMIMNSVAEKVVGIVEKVIEADPHRVALTCILLLAFGLATTFLTTPVSALFAVAVRDLEKAGKLRKGGQGLGIAYSMSSASYAAGALIGPFIGK